MTRQIKNCKYFIQRHKSFSLAVLYDVTTLHYTLVLYQTHLTFHFMLDLQYVCPDFRAHMYALFNTTSVQTFYVSQWKPQISEHNVMMYSSDIGYLFITDYMTKYKKCKIERKKSRTLACRFLLQWVWKSQFCLSFVVESNEYGNLSFVYLLW